MCPYVEQRTYPTLIRWMLGLPSQPHRRRRIHFVSAAAAAPSLQTCRSCPAKAKLLSRTSAEVISANFRTDLRQHSLSWVTKWERVSEIVHPLPRIKVLRKCVINLPGKLQLLIVCGSRVQFFFFFVWHHGSHFLLRLTSVKPNWPQQILCSHQVEVQLSPEFDEGRKTTHFITQN